MKLKKINANLQQALLENGFEEANLIQEETFSTLKSGADAVIQSPAKTGKTTTIVINVIQKMQKPEGESTRALVLVETKEKVLEMLEIFKKFNRYNELRVIGTYEKSDMDEDKNQISAGCDVLVGTPTKINAMFSSAGFNMNTIKFFVVDDADVLFRNRHDSVVLRLSNSVEKMQRVFFCNEITERIEILADKIMIEPEFFEVEDDEIDFSEE